MRVLKIKDIPTEKATHGDYFKQLYLKDGQANHIYQLGKVVLPSGVSTADHGHDGKYEVFLIQQGKGKIIFNGNQEQEVEEGDFVLTEAHETHQVVNDSDQELVLIFLEVKN